MRIKICGITSVEDALLAVECGADSIGLNFWSKSKRRCDREVAARIADELDTKVRIVGVFVDESVEEIERIKLVTGVRWAQLHGDEAPEDVRALLPHAYKAIHETGSQGLLHARAVPGDEILLDARVEGMPGGTGERGDWDLAAQIAMERSLWLAGGLTPENVAGAIEKVRPYGVDVASGVESAPGKKDAAKMRAFIEAARSIAR